ncbi:MAG: FG-GAP-like repeat-containing protein [Reichenbachiella sp.]|uniref:FG-GAP-like repeat-containing protein n=1 Tax=Reichenbachiella sp. TaxID=2184521 RepID=UPI0032988CFD
MSLNNVNSYGILRIISLTNLLALDMQYLKFHSLVTIILLVVFSEPVRAQIPSIQSFTPLYGKGGNVVTIQGQNFDLSPQNNKVYFGTVQAEVKSSSNSILEVIVPSVGGNENIFVNVNRNIAVSPYKFLTTYNGLNFGTSSFTERVELSTGEEPQDLFYADFDNDGKIDLGTANYYDLTFSIFRNISTPGKIEFESEISLDDISGGGEVSVGDMNSDGLVDMIVFSYLKLILYINNSTTGISFEEPIIIDDGFYPYPVGINDPNHDGKLDLNASGYNFLNSSSESNISFEEPIRKGGGEDSNPFLDINADGAIDLVLSASSTFQVFLNKNNGIGNFEFNEEEEDVILNHRLASSSDLNSDTKVDLFVYDPTNELMGVVINNSSIESLSFDDVKYLSKTTRNGYHISSGGDLDGDGYLDIFYHTKDEEITLIQFRLDEEGNFNFEEEVDFFNSSNEFDTSEIVDLDGDGKVDIVFMETTTSKLIVYRNLTETNHDIDEEDDDVLSINRNSLISIYPNPASNQILIDGSGDYTLELFDLAGNKLVHIIQATSLNLSNVKNGVYLLRVSDIDGQHKLTNRIVVSK